MTDCREGSVIAVVDFETVENVTNDRIEEALKTAGPQIGELNIDTENIIFVEGKHRKMLYSNIFK